MTGAESRRLRLWIAKDEENWARLHEGLIARMVCDDDGELLYRPSEVETGVFDNWDAAMVRALGETCDQFSGFTGAAYNVQQIEETAKNSQPAPSN